MKTILVTGGCGYIGSHTIVNLISNGYKVISIDNNSRSDASVLQDVKLISGVDVKNYAVDLCCLNETAEIFRQNKIDGIIHFAAYKAVGESVENPLLYFDNNLNSLINILRCAGDFNIPHFVFSSSCTVYGTPDSVPVSESTPVKKAESPYGSTKQLGEEIVQFETKKNNHLKAVLLRYFNPAGAHPSGLIGESPLGRPQNLVPAVTQTAIGKMKGLRVWGTDYPTKDGTCIRDYVHVCDIAAAHTLALQYLENKRNKTSADIFNLGSGKGNTVLEIINTFESISGLTLEYKLAGRRAGDVGIIFADNSKALTDLGWQPRYDTKEIIRTAWNREKLVAEITVREQDNPAF